MPFLIKSSILGLIVGDALGVPVEFKSRYELSLNPVKGMLAYGTHHQQAGTWSDDSSLTLCLVQNLIEGFDLQNLGQLFVQWLFNNYMTPHGAVFDVGISTRQSIQKLKKGCVPYLAGGYDENSNGNGSLMRILPLLIHIQSIKDPLERFEIIRKVSSLTHAHVRSVLACFYYLEFANQICVTKSIHESYLNTNNTFLNLAKTLEIEQEEVLVFERLTNGNIGQLSENEIKSSGYVIHTLEASLWCIFNTNSYKEAVIKAVNLGEDTDTTGAVVGGLASLIYPQGIPPEWLSQIARIDYIADLLSKLELKYSTS